MTESLIFPTGNWYHCMCTGIEENEINKIDNYFCKQCREWFSFRHSIFEVHFWGIF